MAITEIGEYAHLTEADVESLGRELDQLRRDIEEDRGERDARYIHRTIRFQRLLDLAARTTLLLTKGRGGWLLGTVGLATAKSIENMELGHNISHGQWDWLNDPEIHSTTWEWDMASVSAQWQYSHNYRHHRFTNIVGMDDDIGYGVMRVTRDQPWQPAYLLQPIRNLLLAATFEWGIALHDLAAAQARDTADADRKAPVTALLAKIGRQVGKDYVLFPALSGRRWLRTLTANATANLLRNLWTHAVIFCGHFPDGAEKFTITDLDGESRADWYLRQMLGTANFDAGPALAFMSGNLCYQIEHHLFPDLPSRRYRDIAVRVRELCDKYDLPYTTGPLAKQYLLTLRTIHKLALPDNLLIADCDDAPETASERKFRTPAARRAALAAQSQTGRRSGLRTALQTRKRHRR